MFKKIYFAAIFLLILGILFPGAGFLKAVVLLASFPETAACTALPGVMGDLNKDGLINSLDQTIVDSIAAGGTKYGGYNPCGDFDENAAIDGADSTSLQNLITDIGSGAIIAPLALLADYSFYDPYHFNSFSANPISPSCGRVLGDVNGDNVANSQDYDLAGAISVSSLPYTTCADIDSDGFVMGNDYSAERNIIKPGSGPAYSQYVKPVIDILGSQTQTMEVNSVFAEPGVTATDSQAGDISGSITTDFSTLNSAVLGTYYITYNVTYTACNLLAPAKCNSNKATPVRRIINVVDTTAPVITLTGANPQVIEVGAAYAELGATASDNLDGDISAGIVINSAAVNTAVVGSYSVNYSSTDSQGNTGAISRTVNIVDTTKPVITLVGANPQTIYRGWAYTELGATALDNYDGIITAKIVKNSAAVTTGILGNYTVTYDVTDANGNAALQATRTVSVVTAPSSGGGGGGGGGSSSYTDIYPPTNVSVIINNGATSTATQTVSLTLGATGADYMMISNAADFSGAVYEAYTTTKSWQLLAGNGEKTVYVKFKDAAGNVSTSASDTITLEGTTLPVSELAPQEVLGVKYTDDRTLQLNQILDEAHYLWQGDIDLLLGYLGLPRDLTLENSIAKKYLALLGINFKMAADTGSSSTNALTYFISYGTKTTYKLGAGERAGVVNSYKTAFNKLPKTEVEWGDVLKIANGRWPGESSETALAKAKTTFSQIYLRQADMANSHDNAAVSIMAYGLRPSDRNLQSESTAIKIFRKIFSHNPLTAVGWDAVRTIAYSGAIR